MFKTYNWKQALYKNDVINVVLNGFLTALTIGVLAGCLDYLFGNILNFPISIGLMLLSYFIGFRMRKGYYSFHILYPVLSIFFLIFGLFISDLTYLFCVFPHWSTFAFLGKASFYLNFIKSPVYYLIEGFRSFQILLLIVGILNLAIYIFAFTICYRIVRGRN